MKEKQFIYESADLLTWDREFSYEMIAGLLTALITIEAEHPGTLLHCVRIASLANANFRMTSKSSNPQRSMEAQMEFHDWLRWYLNATGKEIQNGTSTQSGSGSLSGSASY